MGTLAQLRNQRSQLLAIARRHGATNVRIFGSVARDQDTPNSDVDFLVDMQDGRSLLDLVGLQQDLEDLLGRKVNVTVHPPSLPLVGLGFSGHSPQPAAPTTRR